MAAEQFQQLVDGDAPAAPPAMPESQQSPWRTLTADPDATRPIVASDVTQPITPPDLPATPPPPPPPPVAVEPPPTGDTPPDEPAQASTMVAAEKAKPGGWEVDPDRLRSFSDAVVRARSYLDAVQMKVDRMQGAELTPQLGTSPVGQQLGKKFDDRLNSDGGLRTMLAEAMERMEKFVTSAEKAAKDYEAMEQNAVDTFDNYEFDVELVDKPITG